MFTPPLQCLCGGEGGGNHVGFCLFLNPANDTICIQLVQEFHCQGCWLAWKPAFQYSLTCLTRLKQKLQKKKLSYSLSGGAQQKTFRKRRQQCKPREKKIKKVCKSRGTSLRSHKWLIKWKMALPHPFCDPSAAENHGRVWLSSAQLSGLARWGHRQDCRALAYVWREVQGRRSTGAESQIWDAWAE